METNKEVFEAFSTYISAGKVEMYKKMGITFVPGKREGCWIYDQESAMKVINCRSSGGVFNLGHNPIITKKALMDALDQGIDMGDHLLISKQRAEFAKYLADLLPGDMQYTVFGVSGGEAVDLAIKLARAYTGRPNIISTIGGYHGHTGFALATGSEEFKKPFGPLPPGFLQIQFGDIEAARKIINDQSAAFIVETIQATAGVQIPNDEYYKELRKLCDETGTQLIIDEVQAGLGRTGRLWAIDEWDVTPDIMVLGKGMSGALYPLSATCFRPHLQKFFDENPFIHISTAGGSDLACIVAKTMLEETQRLLPNVNDRAKQFEVGLNQLMQQSEGLIVEIRQRGLFIGVEFKTPDLCMLFMQNCLKQGILCLFANNHPQSLIIMPPLIITSDEVNFILQGLGSALKDVSQFLIQKMK